MATVSLIECRPESRYSSPSPTKCLSKPKLSKIGVLSAGNRNKERSGYSIEEIHGLSILPKDQVPTDVSNAIPREFGVLSAGKRHNKRSGYNIDEIHGSSFLPQDQFLTKVSDAIARGTPEYLPPRPATIQFYHTDEPEYEEHCETPLSVVGEKLDALPNLFSCFSPTKFMSRPRYQISSSSSSSSGSSSSCSLCGGSSSPSNPPNSPQRFPSVLKLDGIKMSFPGRRPSSEIRDFKPGLVRNQSVCCKKCQDRLDGYDTMQLESWSPISSHLKHSSATHLRTQQHGKPSQLNNIHSEESDGFHKGDVLSLPILSQNSSDNDAIVQKGQSMGSVPIHDTPGPMTERFVKKQSLNPFSMREAKMKMRIHNADHQNLEIVRKEEIARQEQTTLSSCLSSLAFSQTQGPLEEKLTKAGQGKEDDKNCRSLQKGDKNFKKYSSKSDLKHSPISCHENLPNADHQNPPRSNHQNSLSADHHILHKADLQNSTRGCFQYPIGEKLQYYSKTDPQYPIGEKLQYYSKTDPQYSIKADLQNSPRSDFKYPFKEGSQDSHKAEEEMLTCRQANIHSNVDSPISHQEPEPIVSFNDKLSSEIESPSTPESLELRMLSNKSIGGDIEMDTPSICAGVQNDASFTVSNERQKLWCETENNKDNPEDQTTMSEMIDEENRFTEENNVTLQVQKKPFSKEDFFKTNTMGTSREMLQEIINECAQGLRAISNRGLLPDIKMKGDISFKAGTDKRYNRWKRKKRKKGKRNRGKKVQETSSADDSSTEETENDEINQENSESPSPRFRRRRRETIEMLFGSKQAAMCYDASSELTSSDRDNYASLKLANYFKKEDASISDEEFEAFKNANDIPVSGEFWKDFQIFQHPSYNLQSFPNNELNKKRQFPNKRQDEEYVCRKSNSAKNLYLGYTERYNMDDSKNENLEQSRVDSMEDTNSEKYRNSTTNDTLEESGFTKYPMRENVQGITSKDVKIRLISCSDPVAGSTCSKPKTESSCSVPMAASSWSEPIEERPETRLETACISPENSVLVSTEDMPSSSEDYVRYSNEISENLNECISKLDSDLNAITACKQGREIQHIYSKQSLQTRANSKEAFSHDSLERSLLAIAKDHHRKNQSLSNKKYSDGQLKSKLPNIYDTNKPQRTLNGKQSKNYRNVLDRFVRPLNERNTEKNRHLYYKDDTNTDLIQILQQKKSLVIRNEIVKKETRANKQAGSKRAAKTPPKSRLNEIGSSGLTSLTMNKLLQTMPGHKAQAKKKTVTTKAKPERVQQMAVLDIEKLSMLAKIYAGGGQEAEKPQFKDRSRSMHKCNHYQEEQDSQYTERSISSLSFSRAFTFSMFDLPDSYRRKNKEIERRAYSVIKC